MVAIFPGLFTTIINDSPTLWDAEAQHHIKHAFQELKHTFQETTLVVVVLCVAQKELFQVCDSIVLLLVVR